MTTTSPPPVLSDEDDLLLRRPGAACAARVDETFGARQRAAEAEAVAAHAEHVRRAEPVAEDGRWRRWRRGRRHARLLRRGPVVPVLEPTVDERSWVLGLEGEVRTAYELERLPPGWVVLHAVGVGQRGSDLDHVVLGPCGVVVVNTKNHGSKDVWVGEKVLMVAGQRTDHLRSSRYERDRTARLLAGALGTAVPVQGLVAAHCGRLTGPGCPDVPVLRPRDLVRHLERLPRVLDERQLVDLVTVARRPATWR